jgi:hypothetical protein
MADMFTEHIKKHIAMRKTKTAVSDMRYKPEEGKTSLDEVAEVISLPRFCEKTFAAADDFRQVSIAAPVLKELREYVAIIASRYNDNPFHNFEHACHVTMATNKLLKRIVAPDIATEKAKSADIASEIHNYTHGINSDPLTILAIVFSALIHDVDHRGECSLYKIMQYYFPVSRIFSQPLFVVYNNFHRCFQHAVDRRGQGVG